MLGFAVHAWSVLVVALVLIWLVNGRHGFDTQVADYPFNYHPLFMVLAFLGLETQAVVSFAAYPTSKWRQKLAHAALHVLAFAFMLLGLIFVFRFHADKGFPDLYSLHSWVGLTVCTVFFIQWVIGCAAFLWPGARDGVRLALVTPHRLAGIFIYFGAIVAATLGIMEKQTFILGDPTQDKFAGVHMLANLIAMSFLVLGMLVGLLLFQRHTQRDGGRGGGTMGTPQSSGYELPDTLLLTEAVLVGGSHAEDSDKAN